MSGKNETVKGADAKPRDDEEPRRQPGRPRLCEERLRVVAFKLPESELALFDALAVQGGQTRSQRLRMLVEADIGA